MRRSFFITGTDTGVGKTEAACAITQAFRDKGLNVGVMKPVETGCFVENGKLIPADALRLKEAAGMISALDLINPYRFSPPLSPETASRLFGVTIEFEKIKEIFEELSASRDLMIVEGAGGLLAPVSEGRTMADLAAFLKLPLLIVSANRLGTINHTLLTVQCARDAGLKIAGIILNNISPEADESRPHNRKDIERLSGIPVILEIPYHKKEEAPFRMEEGLLDCLLKGL